MLPDAQTLVVITYVYHTDRLGSSFRQSFHVKASGSFFLCDKFRSDRKMACDYFVDTRFNACNIVFRRCL